MVPYKDLFVQLAEKKIRYLVAGGMAVNFHQVQRATVDLDLILLLEKYNVEKFAQLMKKLGYLPRVPVNPSDLADPVQRKLWTTEKGMTVFSFYHNKNSFETIDVFVDNPFPFDEMEKAKLSVKSFGVEIPVVGLKHLIEMKRAVGRDKDIFDISQLEKIRGSR